ncbi:MAG TPA: ABC transporter ATP-binding protein [Intrasporangium sp.]|uniref:ABC transporter ATP-binding protein n=1 Tax=Intrasporangium sp. TaxID=1925024 RepID=UPI002D791461|nr:ABC transporter ATP-binding protein [Intrasporangium sp.]HET7400098.1 ABC transporter ATP-binding protein [Intrasporangium sp.]
MSILRVEGLTKHFRGVTAVDDVSFEVEQGSILGVIGPNGAGKTTVFNLIAGAIAPDAGRTFLDGAEVTGRPPHVIARAGMVRTFQLMRPFYSMSVLDNVTIAVLASGASSRTARDQAAEIIDTVGLGTWRDAPTEGLPTAALKRLELARALALRPKVLLLDEVLAGLVPTERAPVLDLLERLRRDEGVTLVFVEHIMAAVMRLSDSVLVLNLGRVLTSGPPDEVTKDPRVIEAYLGEEPTRADS